MPNRELSREEREEMSATNVVAADGKDVDPSVWTPAHVAVIRAAAEDPQVERIFVNAAIKKALCRDRRLKSCLALQSAAVVESHVSLPRPRPLPRRQCRLSRPA
jgi:murein endopeptidase